MVKSLEEVIERLQYKADNIKTKLEPSYFIECIEYLKSLPSAKRLAFTKAPDDLISRSELLEHVRQFTSISSGYFENPELLERVIESRPAVPPVCVGVVKFSEEELQRMVDEEIKNFEVDIQKVREQAIEELTTEALWRLTDYDINGSYQTVTGCKAILREVAKDLKGKQGGVNNANRD